MTSSERRRGCSSSVALGLGAASSQCQSLTGIYTRVYTLLSVLPTSSTNEGLAQDPGKVGMTRAARGTTRWRRTPPDARHVPPARLQRARDRGTWSWTWRRDAACRNLGSSLFFAPDGEPASASRRREAAAKAVCARCPVQMPCALYALTTHQSHGVWGGLAEDDRRQSVTDEHRRTCAPHGQP